MDKKELDALLDALFPETVTDEASVSTMHSELPYDPKAGLGYTAKQTDGDKKIMETVRRLDGSERKSAAVNNSDFHRTLVSPAATHARASSSLSTSVSKELGARSKLVTRPPAESFYDKILRKIRR